MAKCRDCEEPVVWATIKGGKSDGKKRCFNPDASEKGRYGLKSTEEKDIYGKQLIEAVYYDDPVEGLSNHEALFEAHYQTCPAAKGGKSAPVSPGPKVFVMVQIGGEDYTGYVSKVHKPKEEEAPF